MKWQQVREQFPDQWLVFLAIEAFTTDDKQRVIRDIAPINAYLDFKDAWHTYNHLHQKDRKQELYIYHTSNPEITITEVSAPATRGRL